jgi:hypothetical protein
MPELRSIAVAAALVAMATSASAAGIIDATAPPVSGASVSSIPFAAAALTPPVAEPETYALLLAGLAGVGLVARRSLPR